VGRYLRSSSISRFLGFVSHEILNQVVQYLTEARFGEILLRWSERHQTLTAHKHKHINAFYVKRFSMISINILNIRPSVIANKATVRQSFGVNGIIQTRNQTTHACCSQRTCCTRPRIAHTVKLLPLPRVLRWTDPWHCTTNPGAIVCEMCALTIQRFCRAAMPVS
jgi:hypothetical protein